VALGTSGNSLEQSQKLGAARKTLAVLAELGRFRNGATLTELSDSVALAPSTLHRILRDLIDSGFAVQDPTTRRYWVGPAVQRLTVRRRDHDLIRAAARPTLETIAARSGETALMTVVDGIELVSIDSILSEKGLRMWGEPGERGPMHATSQGKAVLAQLPEEKQRQILDASVLHRYTDNTIVDRDSLIEELNRTRERGFALNNEERDPGVVSIAVAVSAGGRVIGALSVASLAVRTTAHEMGVHYSELLLDSARTLGDRLGELEIERWSTDESDW
jgi:DNA-binding IclR family transcriptional regulator